ncbi:MAG: hypothetical protein OJF49_004394 [Ktedonobacterales bacterium]|nr:MAG: hypothetical protein OJF49_004394 [Ktedonobacterales bacterium]
MFAAIGAWAPTVNDSAFHTRNQAYITALLLPKYPDISGVRPQARRCTIAKVSTGVYS